MKTKYSNTVAKISRVVALSFIGICLSCEDHVLDETVNPNALSTESFWQTAEDAELGLVGAYSPLNTYFGWGRYFPLTWVRRSDEFTPGYNAPFTEGIMTDPTDIFLPNQWPEAFKIIFRANSVLENVPGIEMDQSSKDAILGQAYYLRAMTYFYLVNVWGNVPLITSPAKVADDFFPSNSTPAEIWAQVIDDATQAQNLLPTSWDAENVGRATWGAATAVLGKAYLYTSDWGNAAAEFKKIIDSNLYSLTANYADNFMESTENNSESVFEIQFRPETQFVWGSDIPGTNRSAMFVQLRAAKEYSGEWIDHVNQWVLDAFLSEADLDGNIDQRAFVTLAWNHPQSTIYLDAPFVGSVLEQNKIYAKKNTGMLLAGRSTDADFGLNTGVNYRLIRYADVLLMHAEAANEAGQAESEILASFNTVRQRANMSDIPAGLTQSQLRDRIRAERVLELSMETDRYFDLARWGVLTDRMNGNADMVGNVGATTDVIRAADHPEAGFLFQDYHRYVPIPIQEISSNPNFEQNPGY